MGEIDEGGGAAVRVAGLYSALQVGCDRRGVGYRRQFQFGLCLTAKSWVECRHSRRFFRRRGGARVRAGAAALRGGGLHYLQTAFDWRALARAVGLRIPSLDVMTEPTSQRRHTRQGVPLLIVYRR